MQDLESSKVRGICWLHGFLDKLTDFDKAMNKVAMDAGILEGANRESLEREGENITLKPHCSDTILNALDRGADVVVISVNWSTTMVLSALRKAGIRVRVHDDDENSKNLRSEKQVLVIANELEFSEGQSTGSIITQCEGANDKSHIFHSILQHLENKNGRYKRTYYIGDSVTDIGALLAADVGIMIGDSSLLKKILRIGGISLRPITKTTASQRNSKVEQSKGIHEGDTVVYQAESWSQIQDTLNNDLDDIDDGSSNGSTPPRVLIISGSDSGGGAGMQADLKTCTAFGVFPMSALTAVTVQNTLGVTAVQQVKPGIIQEQIKSVSEDIGIDAIKIGMLGNIDTVITVAKEISKLHPQPPVVVDPVMIATSGDSLAEDGVCEALTTYLFPLSTIITPNIPEASKLLKGFNIQSLSDVKTAAMALHKLGPKYVLIKGGHLLEFAQNNKTLSSDEDENGRIAVDVLYDGQSCIELSRPYLNASNTHGTGCSLASGIASGLSKGKDIKTAVNESKMFVWRALERSRGLSLGKGSQRPMNLSFRTDDWVGKASVWGYSSSIPRRIPNRINLSLYAVTSPSMSEATKSDEEILGMIASAVSGGATVVQIRDKTSSGSRMTRIVANAVKICRPVGVSVIVNDRVDVAIAADACGVHVGQDDIPAAAVRQMIGHDKILGVSVKTIDQAMKAMSDGADYVGAGAIFPTGTKDSSVIGTPGVRRIRDAISIPVVAIGGISSDNAARVLSESQCHGIAVVSAIFGQSDIQSATRRLYEIVSTNPPSGM